MELTLQREILTDQSTIGKLYADGEFIAFTLEDIVRDGGKIAGKTAIKDGRYQVQITQSVRFNKRLPLLIGVPNFSGVRIHAGNTAENTEGCVLVGLTKGENFVGKSQMAMSLLQPLIQDALDKGEEVWITVKNPV